MASSNISAVLASVSDLEKLIESGLSLASNSSSIFAKVSAVLAMSAEVSSLVSDLQAALPELSLLDPAEAGELTTELYAAVKSIVASVAAKS
jgi:hypothetical protein